MQDCSGKMVSMRIRFWFSGLTVLLLNSAFAQPVMADENFSYYPSSTLDKRGMRAWPYALGNYEFKSGITRYRLSGQVITSTYIKFLCEHALLELNPGFSVIGAPEVTRWLDDALSMVVTLEGPNAYGNKIQRGANCFARIESHTLVFKAGPL